jgi:hypothetical protein
MLEIIQNISALGWTGIALCLLTLIQISPLKIDPWSWLARKIGNALNQDVIKKQDDFQKESQEYRKKNDQQIKNIESSIEKRSAEDARNRILRFGDEIKSKQIRHSEEYYNQILADITDYEKYCKEHPNFKNNRTVLTSELIELTYKQHLENNDFL